MSNMVVKQPTKSILKHNYNNLFINTSNETNDSKTSSWFSKLNNDIPSPVISPRFNNLFGGFRKQQTQTKKETSKGDIMITAELAPRQIRRVRFPVSDMTTEYLFNSGESILEKKKPYQTEVIDIKTTGQLLSLYETICKNKQVPTLDLFVSTLITQPHLTVLTQLNLSNQLIDRYSISPLADIMCVGLGLEELVLNNCSLEDDAIKILMSSLLEHDNIKYLSLAKNSKLSMPAFKYIAVYIRGSSKLNTLDLSYTQPDKKSLEYILAASVKTNPSSISPSLNNLLLNGCQLRTPQLEVLASGIRKPHSTIRELSIRNNKLLNQGILAVGVMLRDYDQLEAITYGLEKLFLDNNDLNQGGSIQYIAQALRRNQRLRHLSLCDCKIDSKSFMLLFEALKYNQNLEKLDISYNPLCLPNLDSISLLRQSLNSNRSLKDIRLTDVGLTDEAAIILAECLSKNNALTRLDLSRNPKIQLKGLLAISNAIERNNTLSFIDINIPTDNKEMIKIHNGIIARCTRNSQTKKVIEIKPTSTTTAHKTARLSLEERLAAVTKGKNIRPTISTSSSFSSVVSQNTLNHQKRKEKEQHYIIKTKENTEDAVLIEQGFNLISKLKDRYKTQSGSSKNSNDLVEQCKKLHTSICSRIPHLDDPSQLDLLLDINDKLTTVIQDPEEKKIEIVKERIEDELSGSFEIGDDDDDDEPVNIFENGRLKSLQELRSQIELDESVAFKKAKQIELEEIDI